MASRHRRMLERRETLLARIAVQRGQIASIGASRPMQLADQAWLAAKFIRKNAWLVAGVAGLLVVRRRGTMALLKGGWRVWKFYRYVSRMAVR